MKAFWIGTNWKMTKTTAEGLAYTAKLKQLSKTIPSHYQLFIIPSFPSLPSIKVELEGSTLKLGAQNMHWEERGAFTGEVSPLMLQEVGVDLIELGHSERRQFYNETDEAINKKVLSALRFGIQPLVCIGEDWKTKENGTSKEHLTMQLKVCLKGITKEAAKEVLIAYEPVWAIGENGRPAEPSYVDEIHTHIRTVLKELFEDGGEEVALLYGGSINLDNYQAYKELDNVDGLFIGRTAWDIESFTQLLNGMK
ncbi:triosephosphate isomerase [Shouchella clausii]|uniref:triose-phosphate isomerase n=1 Tax=Shouchella tritolerans TaxID=2979466 RepID=UPI000788E213|nr:triose-phosphate isomerase [Shouchella tritolerans]GIN11629.1 triosephosphate isomerase [Shouchella clausii]